MKSHRQALLCSVAAVIVSCDVFSCNINKLSLLRLYFKVFLPGRVGHGRVQMRFCLNIHKRLPGAGNDSDESYTGAGDTCDGNHSRSTAAASVTGSNDCTGASSTNCHGWFRLSLQRSRNRYVRWHCRQRVSRLRDNRLCSRQLHKHRVSRELHLRS